MHLRPYTPADRDACLAIFRSNQPRYFLPEEEPELCAFLESPGPWYQVVEDEAGRVVACGGPARESAGVWSVCWMMVDGALHGRGIGRRMVRQCQEVVRLEGPGGVLRLDTSQHTESFYGRMGFETVSREPDGYGPGMDRIEMRQELTPLARGAVRPGDLAAGLDRLWTPAVIAELNGQELKVARVKGVFDWHAHPDADELFWILQGRLRIEYRDRSVELAAGDIHVVPMGVAHRPVAAEEAHILLMEPAGTLNTGDAPSSRTVEAPARIGVKPRAPIPRDQNSTDSQAPGS